MRNIDFNVGGEDGPPAPEPQQRVLTILQQKDQILKVALIEIEGKIPSDEELVAHCGRQVNTGTSVEDGELIIWKGKPIIWFGPETDKVAIINGKAVEYKAITYKFLYE